MAMADTTLHTFLFHCPPALHSVVLFGSWDNFSRPYPLELYAPKWTNLWKGCFAFSDIICDGELDQTPKSRDGLLRMGGTYWYYYKVDDDEEVHNPLEPSTTVCPLLPGQRLNILEMPTEKHSRSTSDTSGVFTRNPSDRYLTPVPPAPLRPLLSPKSGAANPDAYSLPVPSPRTPRSAIYAPTEGLLSPNVIRHVRSASTSPRMPAAPMFVDFKALKEKLASKRSRSSSKSGGLEISSPVLVSTTNDDTPLIPLPGFRPLPSRSNSSESDSIPSIRREFSPLSSHPVDFSDPTLFSVAGQSGLKRSNITRRRSHVPSTVITSEFRIEESQRIRANSTDTRRTQHYLFSNDPWISIPNWPQGFDDEKQVVEDDTPTAPTLQRPHSFLNAPSVPELPTSSHGSDSSGSLRRVPMDKALPDLPKFMAPPPLHERMPYVEYDDLAAEPQSPASEITDYYFSESEFVDEEVLDKTRLTAVSDAATQHDDADCQEKPRSHFSTWSNDLIQTPTSTSPMPPSSSLPSPRRFSNRFSYAELPGDNEHSPTIIEAPEDDELDHVSDEDDDEFHTPYLSPTPPQLEDLRISTFGSDLFNMNMNMDIEDSLPRRQAACFGLGFQYSLPEDETTSKTTLKAEPTLHPVQRESSMSQLNTLMDDFAFLGDAVI